MALERQGLDIQRCEALLIDNKAGNIDKWKLAGGVGYKFTTEAEILANPPVPIRRLGVGSTMSHHPARNVGTTSLRTLFDGYSPSETARSGD